MLWRHNDKRHVVVVVGHTGVGVSSLVNLLAGYPASQKSPDAKQRTRRVQKHPILIRDRYVSLHEIPGFGGDIKDGTLINYVQSLHAHRGIDLVLYCMQPRRETLMPQTFGLLRQYLRGVPFVAVVTALEYYPETMEHWWSRPSEDGRRSNGRILEEDVGMTFQDHVCVTTLPEANVAYYDVLQKRRGISGRDVQEAGLKMRAAICAH